jgi:hypothetical protein
VVEGESRISNDNMGIMFSTGLRSALEPARHQRRGDHSAYILETIFSSEESSLEKGTNH